MAKDPDRGIRTMRLVAARQVDEIEGRCSRCAELQQRKAPDMTQTVISECISPACQSAEAQIQGDYHRVLDLWVSSSKETTFELATSYRSQMGNSLKQDAIKTIKIMVEIVYQVYCDTLGMKVTQPTYQQVPAGGNAKSERHGKY